jgi:glutathione S-transferase
MKLYIGNKNYSTWSLRAWLMLDKSDIKFEEVKLTLGTEAFYDGLKNITPTLKVPTLTDNTTTIWDSLAICEYINDTYLLGSAWPVTAHDKAKARSLACEMHSGFSALRNEIPMNIRAKRKVVLTHQAQQEIIRIESIWSEQHLQFKELGGWLFGQWSIVDAMFAPVVLRFNTYGITLNAEATAYMQHVLSCPSIQKWIADSALETDIVAIDEAGIE